MDPLTEYYSRRAPEYEQIWFRDDPVRQREQALIVAEIKRLFRARRVLEVACGTGFWTQFVAEAAEFVCAIDLSQASLERARTKALPPARVEFREADAYDLAPVIGSFNAGLANFWFSHIPKSRIDGFLRGFHVRLGRGARIFMADNVPVPGLGGELVRRHDGEDTFKRRQLADGSTHEVLKNYYDVEQLEAIFTPRSAALSVHRGECFWWLNYTVNDV